MYDKTGISVKSVSEKTKNFSVKVGVHQQSVFTLYLFLFTINELMKGIGV